MDNINTMSTGIALGALVISFVTILSIVFPRYPDISVFDSQLAIWKEHSSGKKYVCRFDLNLCLQVSEEEFIQHIRKK